MERGTAGKTIEEFCTLSLQAHAKLPLLSLPRGPRTHSGLVLPTSIIIKNGPRDLLAGQSDGGTFSVVSPFPT